MTFSLLIYLFFLLSFCLEHYSPWFIQYTYQIITENTVTFIYSQYYQGHLVRGGGARPKLVNKYSQIANFVIQALPDHKTHEAALKIIWKY